MQRIYGQISGWGAYAPSKVLTNDDLMQMVDTSDEWIVQRSGIRERRVAQTGETTCTMSVAASRDALARAGMKPTELDLIIVATSTPDHLTPPVASEIQYALGATNAAAFVVVTGCTGFVYALTIAYQFMATGAYRSILVIGAELLSRFVNWEDRNTCVLFGDAAGAVVIQTTDQCCGLLGFNLGSDGSQGQHIILPAGGSAQPFGEQALLEKSHLLQMNGREVYKFATRIIGPACEAALAQANLTMAEVDWIIPHQANLRIIEAAAKQMQLPLARFVVNVDRYGNTSAASIPLALTEGLVSGRIQPTDTLLLVSFGAGLTWSAAVVQMQPTHR
ncbi:MAG TPA: beta-ketoacyl-ACP synthase III [Caldilineaceae bacterium]|nr:beta-ketoacyl-ACP synthase III [Caldilineaceae bacterium]